VPIVDRPEGLTILLTQRASHLKHHPGQVSFPGGRVEANDAGPWETALRETEEEIGLGREHVSLAGYLADHFVISGYLVTPAVAFVRTGFELKLDLTEVDEVFEVPLDFVLDPANHVPRERRFGGHTFKAFDIPYQRHNIWGATAGMLMSLHRMLREG
jgi:8-oxo-dGTP pyrophosphatase MutT (NUDIX family)